MTRRGHESGIVGALLDWARLVRLPNHATAVADAAAGFLVVARPAELSAPPGLVWGALAGWAFYAAGMVLNDVFDVALDRVERPERPLRSEEHTSEPPVTQ